MVAPELGRDDIVLVIEFVVRVVVVDLILDLGVESDVLANGRCFWEAVLLIYYVCDVECLYFVTHAEIPRGKGDLYLFPSCTYLVWSSPATYLPARTPSTLSRACRVPSCVSAQATRHDAQKSGVEYDKNSI